MSIAENLSFYLSSATSTATLVSYSPGSISNPAGSTSTLTGALVVSGGLGIGGNLNVGGSITIGGITYTGTTLGSQTYQTYANGVSTGYALPFTPPGTNSVMAYIDGLAEYDFTVSLNNVNFGFVPANNSVIRIVSYGIPNVISTTTLGPGTVTSSSFAAGAIIGGLGYTPANKNGDTFTGTFFLSGSSTLNGWSLNTATAVFTATSAVYLAGTSPTTALTPAGVWGAAIPVTLTDASSITIDMSAGINFSLTTTAGVGATRTLNNPSNIRPGQTGFIAVTQSSGGGNAVTFGNQWHFSTGTITTVSNTANAIDLIYYTAITNSYLLTTIAKQWF